MQTLLVFARDVTNISVVERVRKVPKRRSQNLNNSIKNFLTTQGDKSHYLYIIVNVIIVHNNVITNSQCSYIVVMTTDIAGLLAILRRIVGFLLQQLHRHKMTSIRIVGVTSVLYKIRPHVFNLTACRSSERLIGGKEFHRRGR